MTPHDPIREALQALLAEYGPRMTNMRIGSERRELWMKARDVLSAQTANQEPVAWMYMLNSKDHTGSHVSLHRIETLQQNEVPLYRHPAPSQAAAQPESLDAETRMLVRRVTAQLLAWHHKYGGHNPRWLPPAGDVKVLEDVDAFLAAHPAEKNPTQTAPVSPSSPLTDEAKECLQDVVSHYNDFRVACEKQEEIAVAEGRGEDALYWKHQAAVLDRMKHQAESALTTKEAPAAPVSDERYQAWCRTAEKMDDGHGFSSREQQFFYAGFDYPRQLSAPPATIKQSLQVQPVKESLTTAPPAQAMSVKLPQSVLDFDDFLNTPPDYEDMRMVREYRHAAYPKWQKVVAGIQQLARAISRPAIPEGFVPTWQPIETAPKDGRTILLGYFNRFGKWRTLRGMWASQSTIENDWEESDGCEEGWYETSVENEEIPNVWTTKPTHWMPLPTSPNGVTE